MLLKIELQYFIVGYIKTDEIDEAWHTFNTYLPKTNIKPVMTLIGEALKKWLPKGWQVNVTLQGGPEEYTPEDGYQISAEINFLLSRPLADKENRQTEEEKIRNQGGLNHIENFIGELLDAALLDTDWEIAPANLPIDI